MTELAMDNDSRFVITPRNVLGLSIALLGVLLTLDRLGVMHVEHLFRYYWPVPIILMGGLMLVQAVDHRERIRGAIFTLIGVWLFLSMQGIVRLRIWELFWPVMLILIGVNMALRPRHSHWRRRLRARAGIDGVLGADGPLGPKGPLGTDGPLGPDGPFGGGRRGQPSSSFVGVTDSAEEVSVYAVLSGSRRVSSAPAFKGGDITAIMGGAQLDLRLATIPAGEEAVLDLTVVMGGVEIFVPSHWEVATPLMPVMGGVHDDRLPPLQTDPSSRQAPSRLVLRGFAFMGGVNIKA